MLTAEYVADVLTTRASYYGGTLGDMLSRTPVCLWDSPNELLEFWADKDLSHIYPQSTHPHLAEVWANIVPEDAAINRTRGAAVTDMEVLVAGQMLSLTLNCWTCCTDMILILLKLCLS